MMMMTSQKKQLIFDSRYGWVYDEWRDPVAVAHLGGRGMFSIVPLSKATFAKTVRLAKKAADLVATVLQEPPSLQSIRTDLQISNLKAQERLKDLFGEVSIPISLSKFGVKGSHNLLRIQGSHNDRFMYEFQLVDSNMHIVRPVLQTHVMDSAKELPTSPE